MHDLWVRVAAGVALSALGGCASTHDGPRPGGEPPTPQTSCSAGITTGCDVSTGVCQERLIELAGCVTESDAPTGVTIELLSEEDYAEIVRSDWADYDPQDDRHVTRALAALGLSAAEPATLEEIVASEVEGIRGVYRSAPERRIVLIDRGEALDDLGMNGTFVHEVVHAIQDADYDLPRFKDSLYATRDGASAARAVVEGNARLYQYLGLFPVIGRDTSPPAFEAFLRSQARELLDGIDDPETRYDAVPGLPYDLGAVLAWNAYEASGTAGTDELFGSPLTTSWQVLAPMLGVDAGELEVVEIAEPVVDELVLDGFDTLGAFNVKLLLLNQGVDGPTSDQLAMAWRGDRLSVYTDDTGSESYALWQLELASDEAATAVDRVFPDLFGNIRHGVAGRRLFVSIGPIAQLTDWGQAWLAAE